MAILNSNLPRSMSHARRSLTTATATATATATVTVTTLHIGIGHLLCGGYGGGSQLQRVSGKLTASDQVLRDRFLRQKRWINGDLYAVD